MSESELSATEIAAFLKRHPDFFAEHPDVLHVVQPANRPTPKGVADFTGYMVRQLQRDLAKAKLTRAHLLATTEQNHESQAQVLEGCLLVMRSESLADLAQTICRDIPRMLKLNAASLCLEDHGTRFEAPHLTWLPRGGVDAHLPLNRDISLRPARAPVNYVFGPNANGLKSEAMIRLRPNAASPMGLLGLGSVRDGMFEDGQDTTLLNHLARVVEARLERLIPGDEMTDLGEARPEN